MGKSLTIYLADEDYEAIQRAASAAGRAPEEWAKQNLLELLPSSEDNPFPGYNVLPEYLKTAMQRQAEHYGVPVERYAAEWWTRMAPKPAPPLTEAQWEAARQRLAQHAGAANLGYATGADNEGIDADLMRDYVNNHAGTCEDPM